MIATAIYKKNKYTFGASFTRDFPNKKNCCSVGVEAKCNDDLKVKGKLNCCLGLELASVYKVNDLLTATTSCKLDLSKKAGCVDFNSYIPFPIGF